MRRALRWGWPWILATTLACGDDGGAADDDGGGSTSEADELSPPLCGDGLIEGEEQCEPPINGAAACDPSTCRPTAGWECHFVTPEGGELGMFRSSVCSELPVEPEDLCGNGVLDPGEACDDLHQDDGDGCSAACQIEPGWDCTDDLPSRCGQCGDGVATFGLEECDGGGVAVPGCTIDCVVEPGWICTNDDVCAPICGDGVVLDEDDGVPDYYAEGCDDSNAIAGDGCTACTVETGWECTGSPSVCSQFQNCGNGVIERGEECDDGTMDNSDSFPDACRTNCRNPRCGDLTTDSDEECDDGNTVDTDDCSNACQYNVEVDCGDGVDEDDDGDTDCDDSDCDGDPLCPPV